MAKKQSKLSQLMVYAGNHRYLTYLSLLLSAVSAVLALFPFMFLFFMIREVLEVAPNYAQASHVVHNGWMAVLFAVLSILVYICGLMCSHLSAFWIAGNIRKALMAHIAELPLGFIGEMGSGKIRRIVNDSSAATETYLAHQLPDMAAAITTPICMVVMLLLFDWRFGLASLIPIILGFSSMLKMTGPGMAKDMKDYMDALADMNNEAVEYVRGVPVVKTFGQTVHSFKRFKSTIDNYYKNGSTLSGGERQRISIARALLKNAPIILLDEATASLDAENETEIQQAISRLVKDKTVLIIAHRMRTVENADKIVVLSGGTVAEMGTPEELVKQNGTFAQMVRLQNESKNWTLT